MSFYFFFSLLPFVLFGWIGLFSSIGCIGVLASNSLVPVSRYLITMRYTRCFGVYLISWPWPCSELALYMYLLPEYGKP
ncbi:hypothetical protein DFH27DRAFT_540371 [Peziza echinospora]|nr:hypothetical protein DFH27DRAFT_540371 [Peziza echinospora]